MVRSTVVVRASDALPLAASVDDEQVGCHSMNSLRCHSSLRASFVTVPFRRSKLYKSISSKRKCYSGALRQTQSRVFPSRAVRIHTSMSCNSCAVQALRAHQSAAPCSYLIADNVGYLTIADKSYPRKLAFSYLDELSKEFSTSYGPKVETVRKPYAFVGFGQLPQRIVYRD
jgi:vesicle transport protein SEC22